MSSSSVALSVLLLCSSHFIGRAGNLLKPLLTLNIIFPVRCLFFKLYELVGSIVMFVADDISKPLFADFEY
jgi:hypothetical protein